MRKDDFVRSERRWSQRRGLFSDQPRRRFPWRMLLLVLILVGIGFALSRSDLNALLANLQSLWPAHTEQAPKSDPNRLPLLPLPPPSH
jgi:hypothetical protein